MGKTFGRLYVESFSHIENKRSMWNCVCECGNKCVIKGKYLANGDTKSCGCITKELAKQMGKRNINRNNYEYLNDTIVKVYYNNTNNYFLCDSEDWEVFKDYTWFESEAGYTRGEINGRMIFFHDLVMNIKPSKEIVCDHFNRKRFDNRKENLRCVDRATNAINKSMLKNNTSGKTGVSYSKSSNKWVAYIRNKIIGYYNSFDEASEARDKIENIEYAGIKYYDNQRIN